MIPRLLTRELETQLGEYPVVTILGPRQAGKTTLARAAVPDFKYVSLEDPSSRAVADEDPRSFLKEVGTPAILDEIQRAPHLLSYIQGIVDESSRPGQYVLTGSHQLQLRESVTQSLAGRTGMLFLLPLSIEELTADEIRFESFSEYVFRGSLPRVYADSLRPHPAYASYYQTYVERDVRQLINLKDSSSFERFMKLLAGRVGQVMNQSSLARDVGVDQKTIRDWLSVLEASFVVVKLTPYFANFGKRVIKSPKYYFGDTGLLAFLLGITKPEQILRDPLVGGMFENLVVLEAMKARHNRGTQPNLSFFRDSHGIELDLMVQRAREVWGCEIKSTSTYSSALRKGLNRFQESVTKLAGAHLIYSGESVSFSNGNRAVNFRETADLFAE